VPDVPIGLVCSAVGGTPAEAWMSMARLQSIDSLEPLLERWTNRDDLTSKNRPANLYNAMIAPLSQFPIRGVIWYQGEANVGRASQYRTIFPALIEDWRELFGQPELPFYFAQLAPFRYETLAPESLPELWEAQLQTLQSIPNTGMAVLTDVGNVEDIHPKNKQAVGQRLARLALANLYAEERANGLPSVDATGPIFDSATNGDDRIRIRFTGCESGLKIAGESETLSGFTISGEDQQFYPAKAEIVDSIVEVYAAEVPHPKAVRFGWQDAAAMNLVNGEGLPASPFRTDDFPTSSESRDF
jgi:sialate O-acetylesterase